MRFSKAVVLLIGLIMSPCAANAQSRVALVIGNGSYQNVSALPNPVNDAGDISESLKRLGFDVRTIVNAKFDDMRRALISFGQRANGAEFAVVFFAGHGMEIDGENWLIPVDAQLATDRDVPSETIGLQFLTRAVSSSTKLGLVILDACRNNPFLSKMQRTNMSRAVDRGFVRVEPGDNVLVAYAARDGTTANDGSGRNSPFTSALLKNIETPGLEVRFLFANVRDDVMTATNRGQQPFIYGSLSRNLIYFKPALPNAGATDPAPSTDVKPAYPSTNAKPASGAYSDGQLVDAYDHLCNDLINLNSTDQNYVAKSLLSCSSSPFTTSQIRSAVQAACSTASFFLPRVSSPRPTDGVQTITMSQYRKFLRMIRWSSMLRPPLILSL